MTAYIYNNQKKKRLFKKREQELRHAIKNKHSQKKIILAAENVRKAKLQVFKSNFSDKSVLPASKFKPLGKAKEWLELSVERIIENHTE